MMTPRDHYEPESFNYKEATVKSPSETPNSNTESPSRSTVMSPMPGPMAFTIDFGSNTEAESETKKKLSLRDGIRMFAPNKKKSPAPSTTHSGHASLSPRTVPDYEKKKEFEATPVYALPRDTIVKIASTAIPTDTATVKKVKSVKGESVGVDADNNITNDTRDTRNQAKGGDTASEAGTYTIDQDEQDADGEEDHEDELSGVSKPSIMEKFSVREDQWSTKDWVDRWASSSLPTTILSTDPDDDYEDDFEDDEEQHSFSSVRDSDGGKSSRRRLPPTPMKMNEKMTSSVTTNTTEDCLKETISVMAAMEARLSSKTLEGENVAKNLTSKTSTRVEPLRKQSLNKKPLTTSPMSGSSTGTINKGPDRLAAWQRRKNYDPMKAAINGKVHQSSSYGHQSPSQSVTEESYSGSCSDLDLQNEHSAPPRGSHFMVHGLVNNVSVSKQTPDRRSVGSAKTNREFGLRQANSMISSTHSAIERTNSKSDFTRSEKFSSLTNSRALKSQASPHLSAVATQKKMAPGVAAAVKSGRSTSSLSSKEAEYQAWKRRKNYNPLRSAAAANGTTKKDSQRPSPKNTTRPASNLKPSQSINTSAVRRITAVTEVEGEDNIHRSASFHYPDGFSRVQHNVFTSEDEDCDSGMVQPRLYEVNDDELVLAIGRVPSLENGVYHSNRVTGMRSSPSRGSPSRLETLDNLVISTIFSVSTKLCLTSGKLIRRLQDNTTDKDQLTYLDTLLYVLEDVEPEVSPSKKTSRELAGTLRNLKKVEQALQTLDRLSEQDI